MLNPAPVGRGARWSAEVLETLPGIAVLEGLVIVVLVPHGIGDDVVEGVQARTLGGKAWIAEGIADGKSGLGVVVQEHVHLRHGEGDGIEFLSKEQRSLAPVLRIAFLKEQTGFDEQATGATGAG